MLTFDKIKVILPLDAVDVTTNHPEWAPTYAVDNEGQIQLQRLTYGNQKEQKTRHRPHVGHKGKYRGINYVSVNYPANQVEVILTGKVLDNPAQLISLDTISQVWDRVNATGLLYGYGPEVIPQMQLCSTDVTADCIMSNNPNAYTSLISRYYVGKTFVQARDYSPNIQLQHRSKTAKHSRTLTGYNKNLESEDAAFSPNTLRWELRLTSFEMLRKYLGLPSGPIMLPDALRSKENAIYSVLQEILKEMPLTKTMKTLETPAPEITTETRATLFATQELSFDERAVFARLKEISFNLRPLEAELKGDKNAARKMKPYREVFTKWQSFTADSCNDINLLNEIVDKVRNATIRKAVSETIREYAAA